MMRREFIALLGGAAAAWPLAARAQQAERMRRIGVLMTLGENDPLAQARLTAFTQSLEQFGWGVGRNVKIDYRYGGGNADLIRHAFVAPLGLEIPSTLLARADEVIE